MPFTILCTGDLHLGKPLSSAPDSIDREYRNPSLTWRRVIDMAITKDVDAVVLTGDVVDENNKIFEAYSRLKAGVEQLVKADIHVLAVAGNHDHDVLPRLADEIEGFHHVGRNGRWESVDLVSGDGTKMCFVGWSFPDRHVANSPIETLDIVKQDNPTVGILHCDLDSSSSVYGPVKSTDLKQYPVDVWLLGHIHTPDTINSQNPLILYPGSPQGLDPSEHGPHGPWLVTVGGGQEPVAEFIPLAALVWDQAVVDLAEVNEENELFPVVIRNVQEALGDYSAEAHAPAVVGLRLRLVGRTALYGSLGVFQEQLEEQLHSQEGAGEYFIEKVIDETEPILPIQEIAGSTDPAGLIAQKILILDERSPEDTYRTLIDEGTDAVREARGRRHLRILPDSGQIPDEEEIRELMLNTAYGLIERMLEQKGSKQ